MKRRLHDSPWHWNRVADVAGCATVAWAGVAVAMIGTGAGWVTARETGFAVTAGATVAAVLVAVYASIMWRRR